MPSAFVPDGEGHAVAPFPGVSIRTTTGDGLMVSVVRLDAGAEVPAHAHDEAQMGYLVSGTLSFTIGDETREVRPGDVWDIPPGVRHRVVAVGGPAVAIDVFHPPRPPYVGPRG